MQPPDRPASLLAGRSAQENKFTPHPDPPSRPQAKQRCASISGSGACAPAGVQRAAPSGAPRAGAMHPAQGRRTAARTSVDRFFCSFFPKFIDFSRFSFTMYSMYGQQFDCPLSSDRAARPLPADLYLNWRRIDWKKSA